MILERYYSHWNENAYYLALEKFYSLSVGYLDYVRKSVRSGVLVWDHNDVFKTPSYTTTPNEILAQDHTCANGA